jgi:hypothetical protein
MKLIPFHFGTRFETLQVITLKPLDYEMSRNN